MSGELRWSDAREAAAVLERRPTERRVLLLLDVLPFLSARVSSALVGLSDAARVYLCLADLRAAGLVDFVRPSFRPHGSPRLPYLTDLGLAAAARLEGLDVAEMVRRRSLARADLLQRIPRLAPLRAIRSLLGAVAASRPGRPCLLGWRQPWRHRIQLPTAKDPVSVTLPAYAELSWDDVEPIWCFLIPDAGTIPLSAHRPTIDRLTALRHARGGSLPPLVVATVGQARVDAWNRLLEERAEFRREAPLAACIARWRDLDDRLRASADRVEVWRAGPRRQALRTASVTEAPSDGRRLPVFVGAPLSEATEPESREGHLARLALTLTARDLSILQKVGPHPFLSTEGLALWLGQRRSQARHERKSLIERGLLRLLSVDDLRAQLRSDGRAALLTEDAVNTYAEAELAELTFDGLELLAAHLGLTLRQAERYLGLCGGGPSAPVGSRAHLLRILPHTFGADGVVIRLMKQAHRAAASGSDDAVLTWQNAKVCSRGFMRPDAYGVYRRTGQLFPFFVEWDRRTMKRQQLKQKLRAYHEFFAEELARGRAGQCRDYLTFPTILFVTVDKKAEDAFVGIAAQVAQACDHGARLPLLTTTEELARDPTNPDDLLGRIWRRPDDETRRGWLSAGGTTTPVAIPTSRRAWGDSATTRREA